MTAENLQKEAQIACINNELDATSLEGHGFVSGYMCAMIKKEKEQIVNAQIKRTDLGPGETCGFTLNLTLDIQDGYGVIVGGVVLDTYDKKKDERVGTTYGMNVIMRVMEVVGVRRWEDLEGKYIRVVSGGIGSSVTKIGNLMKDDWIDFTEYGKEWL